jgi:hypothetical protein
VRRRGIALEVVVSPTNMRGFETRSLTPEPFILSYMTVCWQLHFTIVGQVCVSQKKLENHKDNIYLNLTIEGFMN